MLHSFKRFLYMHTLILFLCLTIVNIALSGELAVAKWLLLGPCPTNAPVFAKAGLADSLLSREMLSMKDILPEKGAKTAWYPGETFSWKTVQGEEITLPVSKKHPAIAYLAAYITTDRRQDVTIRVETPYPASLYVDGSREAKITGTAHDNAPNLHSAVCDLHTGKHLLVIKTVKPDDASEPSWTVKVAVSPEFSENSISLSTIPERHLTQYKDYALFDRVRGLVISPDGKRAALVHSRRDRDTFKSHSWIEVRSTVSGELLNHIEFAKSVSRPVFAPNGDNALFFLSSGFIWRYDLRTGRTEKATGKIDGLVRFVISPQAKFVYYTTDSDRVVRGTDDYTMQSTLEERLTDWTDARRLKVSSLEKGVTHVLSETGGFAVSEFGLSPEGDKLVFTRRIPSPGRPYMDTEFWLTDLKTGEHRLLMSKKIPFESRPRNLTLLPGGKHLAYTSVSYYTDDPESEKHNLSEADLYLMNLKTGEAKNLTGDTPFTIDESGGTLNSLLWNPRDKRLYFAVMVGRFNKVYSIDIHHPDDLREVPIPLDYIKRLDMSADGTRLVFSASTLKEPESAYVFDLGRKKHRKIFDPNTDLMERVKLADFDRCDFTNRDGHRIDGWIFYPPDFDPAEKYPLIVYYYAGVWMLSERFIFTYHYWTANGYILYALSPVGAMGYGDAFSDYHVNDWGTHATQDIIEGVEKLTAEKSFIDAERMGCYGGSYGGFTTMDLITKTDIFACAVSNAGISNIASYWGGGTWGYTYGDIALANSYPWNRKELFTDNSPLFNADKINTPLLLQHGAKDNNVPPLESDQMFTALRVLDKDVAIVRFAQEGHSIAGEFKNYIAHREIMLEWFDKYLKDQPEGWERRWKNLDWRK